MVIRSEGMCHVPIGELPVSCIIFLELAWRIQNRLSCWHMPQLLKVGSWIRRVSADDFVVVVAEHVDVGAILLHRPRMLDVAGLRRELISLN